MIARIIMSELKSRLETPWRHDNHCCQNQNLVMLVLSEILNSFVVETTRFPEYGKANCKKLELSSNLLIYWCSIMAFMLSSNERRRSWLPSLANRNPGDDMEEKR